MYHKVIGIDLGTTFSVVSAFNNETGQPEAFEVPGMQPPRVIFPSIVSISRQGRIQVGWPARRNMLANPHDTVTEVKRIMGGEQLPSGEIAQKAIQLGGQEFLPQEISAMILKELKKVAEQSIGSPIHDAVITVPAYFHETQRKATEDAARIAQLNPRLLINEPTAAATAYGMNIAGEEERILIVYDLGGGTFDVSVIRVDEKTVEVMGTSGDDHLGGGDFDEQLTDWVFNQLEKDYPGSGQLRKDPKLRARVKSAAEQAKIELSGSDFAIIEVVNLTSDINVYYEIDNSLFISLLEEARHRPKREEPIGLLDETMVSIEEAFRSAQKNFKEGYDQDTTIDDVDEFLLVGGSTRILKIREMLESRFNRPVRFDTNIVDRAVSLGAAIVALEMDPMDAFDGTVIEIPERVAVQEGEHGAGVVPTLLDVTGHTLGIAVEANRFHRLILKDTKLPAEETHRDFTTQRDNQTMVAIRAFQGEDPIADNNTFLGEILIDGLEPRPVGHHLFDVMFSMNASGMLVVTAIRRVRDNSGVLEHRDIELKSDMVRLSPEELAERQNRIDATMNRGFENYQQPTGSTVPPTETPPYQEPPPSSVPPGSSKVDMEAQIPAEYRYVWRQAKEKLVTLDGEHRQRLEAAIKSFEDAVKSGDPTKIEGSANAMLQISFG